MIKERVKLVGYQPFLELKKGKATIIRNRKDIYDEPVLQDSLFLTNGKELFVLTRVKEIKEHNEADYGYKQTYIPIGLISSVILEPDTELEHIRNLRFRVLGAEIEFKVGTEFPIESLKGLLKI